MKVTGARQAAWRDSCVWREVLQGHQLVKTFFIHLILTHCHPVVCMFSDLLASPCMCFHAGGLLHCSCSGLVNFTVMLGGY